MRIEKCGEDSKVTQPEATTLSFEEILKVEGIYKPNNGAFGHVVVLRQYSGTSVAFYVAGLIAEPCEGIKGYLFTKVDARLFLEIKQWAR